MKKLRKALVLALVVMLCASIGIGQATAADSNYIKERLSILYEDLTAEDRAKLRDSRDRIQEILDAYESEPGNGAEYEAIVDDLWSKIAAEKDNEADDPSKGDVLRIVLKLASITYDPEFSALDAILADAELRSAMDAIVKNAGISNGIDAITSADAGTFFESLEDAINIKVDGSRSLDQALRNFINSFGKYNELLDEMEADNVTAKLLKHYTISLSDIINIVLNVADAETPGGSVVDPDYRALAVLVNALIGIDEGRSGGSRPPIYIPPVTPVTPPALPAELIPLPSTFEDMVRERIREIISRLQQDSEGVTSQTEQAKNIVSTVESALREATSMIVETDPAITDSKAVFNLDADSLIEELEANTEIRERVLEEAASMLSSTQAIELEWFILFSHEGAQQNEVKIPAQAIERAQELGITRITVSVGGGLVSVPIGQVNNDIIFIVEKVEDTPDTDIPGEIRGMREIRAEDSEGNVLQDLGGRYFKVGVPVEGTNRSPYLTMFRIGEDGEAVNVGGQYNSETGMFEAYRNTFSIYVVAENRVRFEDVDSVRWAYQAIHELAAKGIVSGRGHGEFDPLAPLTRAEFAAMLVNLLNVYDENAAESFTDVADGSWYQPYIASAVKHGLVLGRGDGKFAPQDYVTRAEMAVMASRALQGQVTMLGDVDVETQFSKYSDTDHIYEGMQQDLALAIREGIIGGVAEGQLQPQGVSNRAQAAVIIHRLYQMLQ